MKDLSLLFDLILHEGLMKYKKIGSRASLPNRLNEDKTNVRSKKGIVFVTRSKEDLHSSPGVKGYIISSKESVIEDCDTLSHWTPNVFNYGTYTNAHKKYIKGMWNRIDNKLIHLLLILIQKNRLLQKF